MLSDVKAELGIPSTETSADDLLQRLITSESNAVLQWLSRALFLDTYTERRTGTGTAAMTLREFPVRTVKSLTMNGLTIQPSTSPSGPGYAFENDTLYLIGGGGAGVQTGPGLYFNGVMAVFPRMPPLGITVTYTAGYDDDEIPTDITDATIWLVALRYKERDRIGHVSKGLAGETTTYSQKDMPDHVRRKLRPYQRVAPII